MKKLSNEKGAITVLVLVSVLFMVSFLISSYVIIANKVRAQKDMISQMRDIYDNTSNMEEIYNSYFMDNVVPIYNNEQLFAIGTGTRMLINGKYYDFLNDDSTMYVLMNDLSFNAYDQGDDYYWVPIKDRIDLLSSFNGNGHKISVNYVDSENDEYTVIYSGESNFSEPEYKMAVRVTDGEGKIYSDAVIHVNDIPQEKYGDIIVSVKRLKETKIYATLEGHKGSDTTTILIENPNKMLQNLELILGKYTFAINPTPSNATVTINGEVRNSISVSKGTEVSWRVEAVGHVAKEGTYIVQDDSSIDVSLDLAKFTFTITPTPSDATVIIDGVQRNSITVDYGTTVSYSVAREGYYSQEGSIQVTENRNMDISLRALRYIAFSENFYFTRCSNNSYSGLLNGGEASISKYDLTGGDYSMGAFYVDESNIITKIPSNATISKVTVYFQYNQSRNNTTLYKNRIKTSIYTGNTQKMSTQQTDYSTTSVRQATYALTNISRQDLQNGLVVNLTSYIEGTLEIKSTVKNLYCVIEGEYPDV